MELKIHLKDIRLYGYHGVHPLEKQVGIEFIIDINIIIHRNQATFLLTDTIDYESIFLLLKEEFIKTESLLENLANRIIHRIHTDFPSTQAVDISIMKVGAPITNFQGKVGISISKTFYQV